MVSGDLLMIVKSISSKWFEETGNRLDCNPYMSGAFEARHTLNQLLCECVPLRELTSGYSGGIYNGPVFKRNFVKSKDSGVPFLTSAIMLRFDLRNIPLLSKKDALSRKLSYLELHSGMIMISCSGAIGNMVYVRADMEGYWSCQDQLKLSIDENLIGSGYVYAFLNSKFGMPLITGGTYGAIIQHLEPEHIHDIPVPKLPKSIEHEIDGLVKRASELKTEFIELINTSSLKCEELIGWSSIDPVSTETSSVVSSKLLKESKRMDVLYFNPVAQKVKSLVQAKDWKYLDEVSDVVKPGMFKRIMSKQEDGGIPFHTGSELFLMDAKPKYFVSAKTSNIGDCILDSHWVLIQGFGQRGGLIARVLLTTDSIKGAAATDLQIQLRLENEYDAAFIFAYLNSQPGYHSLIRLPIGGSIPNLNPKDVSKVEIPWPDNAVRKEIGGLAAKAWKLRDEAERLEKLAISKIEASITSMVSGH